MTRFISQSDNRGPLVDDGSPVPVLTSPSSGECDSDRGRYARSQGEVPASATASEDEYSDHSRSDSSGGQSQEEGDSFEDFEEEELLASDFSELHEATLPGSPTTKAAAFLVNELPPDARTKNCMLGGLWFGSHPDMSLFMAKFVDELNQCGGIMWKHATTVVRSAIHAICCCVDAPARAAMGSINSTACLGVRSATPVQSIMKV
ncbi:hypothetical protein HPB52_010752 [Rhipicephalus sanguineus]|uniref:Uncharacterized protein n=1 Tax=Rhipicephalus sanguineus TaxID=34632 RepID=A0A9D4PIE1_RHISA|nr:hypothetical protein HPB52_010752 [Rhipicephalus sanguineus]